jgi:hypothetical protein
MNNAITLPADFPFRTNAGLHGDMQFFEMPSFQLTYEGMKVEDDRATFTYQGWDSEEGQVMITYVSTGGAPAVAGHVDGFDVEISTGSDVWDLTDTQNAITDAIALHVALGHSRGFDKFTPL